MIKGMPQNISELFMALAALKRPEEILRLFFRLCTDGELAELGLRFQADAMVRKRLPLDEILDRFPGRADVVARVLMHQAKCFRKTRDLTENKSNK